MTRKRKILVTGASRGIGRAIAEDLLEQGHTVIGMSRQPASLSSDRYVSVTVDLSQLDTVSDTLSAALEPHGDLDAVISNAGGPVFGNLEELNDRSIRAALDLNLTSHILLARNVIPRLKRHEHSDLVIMGSEAALRGGRKGAIYCAAKFGLRGFSQALREECAASGVRVTLINPGMVRTPFFDDLDFYPGEREENAIEVADVAAVVRLALDTRPGTVLDEINLSPLKKVVRRRKDDD